MSLLPYPKHQDKRVQANDRILAKEVRNSARLRQVDTVGGWTVVPKDTKGNGFVVKAPSANWKNDGGSNGEAQAFMLLREDYAGGAEAEPDRNILFRVNGHTGGIGTADGIHIATGLRQRAGFAATTALWIQPSSGQNPVHIIMEPAAAQTVHLMRWDAPSDTTGNLRGEITAAGHINTFNDAGTTSLAQIAATTAGAFGARAIFQAGATTTIPLHVKGAASQTADLFQAADSAGTVLWRVRAGGVSMARVFHNAHQSIANNTLTALAFNSERFDTDTLHDTATNNSRLTATVAGVYLMTSSIQWASDSVGFRQLTHRVNGATFINAELDDIDSAQTHQQSITTIYKLAANDYVETVVRQTSGAALDCQTSANYAPEFSMSYLGAG